MGGGLSASSSIWMPPVPDLIRDPLHGHQEGRFFHGYYDCYCYLPLYIFCGRHLLCSKLRRSNIDASAGSRQEVACIVAQIRARWPKVEIWLTISWTDKTQVGQDGKIVTPTSGQLRTARAILVRTKASG